MSNPDEMMKQLMAGQKMPNFNVDDELAALEAEVNAGAKGNKNADDIDLEELEKEGGGDSDKELAALEQGLDDYDSDGEEKKKATKKAEPPKKEEPKPQPKQEEPTPQTKKEEPKVEKAPSDDDDVDDEDKPKVDLGLKVTPELIKKYAAYIEKKYHDVKRMNSVSVLDYEWVLMDKIIDVYDDNEMKCEDCYTPKLTQVKVRKGEITNKISFGLMDEAAYLQSLKMELKVEEALIGYANKDKNISPEFLKPCLDRINKRISLIKEELGQAEEMQKQAEEEAKKEEEERLKKIEEEKKKAAQEKVEVKPEPETKTEQQPEPKAEPKAEHVQEKLKLERAPTTVEELPEKERVTKAANELLTEYKQAYDYFKANDMPEQQKKCMEILKDIATKVKAIKEGNWRDVNEFELPESVTPDFICGCNAEERKKKFEEAIKAMILQRKEEEMDKAKIMEILNKVPKSKQKAAIEKYKPLLDNKVKKINSKKAVLENLKLAFQDKWTPPPEHVVSEEVTKKEKVNDDVSENVLHVFVGDTDYRKSKTLYCKFEIDEDGVKKEEEFQSKKEGIFNHSFKWEFNPGDFKTLFRKTVKITIFEKGFFGGRKIKANSEVKLADLKSKNQIKDRFKIDLETKRFEPYLEITFNIHAAIKDKEYLEVTKEVFNLTKIYPSYKDKKAQAVKIEAPKAQISQKDLQNSQQTAAKPQAKPVPKPAPKPAPKPGPGPNQAQGVPNTNKKVDRSMFTDTDINDIDNINNMLSIAAIGEYIARTEAWVKSLETRTPKDVRMKLTQARCMKQHLESQVGDIGPQKYLDEIVSLHQKSVNLSIYFSQAGPDKDDKKAAILAGRAKAIENEIKELKEYMKNPQ